MSGVDDRIVSMTFDNSKFESRISATIASLDKLTETIKLAEAHKGLSTLSDSANRFDISKMAAGIDHISSKFSALGAIGFTAISKITGGVLDFVKNTAGDILGPIITGGKQRALNIEQAKFMFRGLGIDVEAGMKSAKDAVLGTAYGLDEAAKAAAQFGASGIKVGPEMTGILRGIAGAAAMTGSSFTEMADIMTGSAAIGKVTNQDLMQFGTRGLNAAAAVGKVMGKSEAQIHEMATKGTLDFNTFAKAMDTAFGEHATKANETYAGALSNVKAAMSRLGASFFGDRLTQQRDIFNALTPVIDKVTAALKPMIDVFNAAGRIGTDKLVAFLKGLNFDNFNKAFVNFAAALKNVFTALSQVMSVVSNAWGDVFPKSKTSVLVGFSELVLKFTEHLKMGVETLAKLGPVFRGIFSVVEIGWTILKEVVKVIGILIGGIGGASGGILDFAMRIGIWLQVLNDKLVEGGGIHKFFLAIGAAVKVAIVFIQGIINTLGEFFAGLSGKDAILDAAGASVGRVSSRFENLHSVFERLTKIPPGLQAFFNGVKIVLDGVWEYIKTWFSGLGHNLANAFKPGDFNSAVDIVNVGLLGGIGLFLKKFVDGGLLQFVSGGGLLEKLNGIFDGLTGQLKAMQAQVKADTLMKIALAIGALTASVLVLSLIDSVNLTKALTAMAVGFGELVGVMKLLDQIASGPMGAAKLNLLVAAMIGLAGAMLILSISMKIISTLDSGELAKGLIGVAGGLSIMVGAMKLMPTGPGMISSALAMIFIAGALLILSAAVKSFSKLSWGEMAKGLVGIAGGLVIIEEAMWLMPPGMLLIGLGLIAVATALNILALAVKSFAEMSLGEMAKGLGGIAAGLVIIAAAMWLMPPGMVLTSLGLLQVAFALEIMARAIKTMGEMKLGDLVKGLGALAIVLDLLSVAMIVMTGTAAGAAAMLVAAAALLVISHVLKVFGDMKAGDIIKALLALAGVFIVLGLAALILEPLIPALLGLGIALGIIGIAMALFGAGAYLVAIAFETMARAGRAGVTTLLDVIEMFITALPRFVGAFIKSILDMGSELLAATPLLLRLVTAILIQLLDTVITLTPKIGEAIAAIIKTALKLIRELFPDILQTGFDLLMELLRGIRDHIEEITTLGIDIVVKLANTLVDNAVKLAAAAIELLLKFLGAIAERASDIATAGSNILLGLIKGISDNISKILSIATDIIVKFIEGIVSNYDKLITAGRDAIIAFLGGLASDMLKVITAAKDIVLALIKGIADNTLDFARKAADLIINFLNELATVIREKTSELNAAGKNLSGAIIDGMMMGLKDTPVIGSAIKLAQGIIGGVKGAFDSKSPSKVFMKIGRDVIKGLAIAFDTDNTAKYSAITHGQGIVKALQGSLDGLPNSLAGLGDFNPVITPVLDLTKVQLASKDLNSLMAISPITPDVSYKQARIISTTSELESQGAAEQVPTGPAEVKFEQNIFSPTALSTNDIYRNTKSQIALAKEELSIP